MPSRPSIKRGDVVLVPFPNSDLVTTKLRPGIVVQSDSLASELPQVLIAMITSRLDRAEGRSRVLITRGSANAHSSGLLRESVVMADNLATVLTSRIVRAVGRFADMSQVDQALRHALGL